jgi:hypothetical protein
MLQIQTKRELFFKGGSGSLTSPPAVPTVPSVPPPQPPANANTTSTLPAPVASAPPGAPAKPRQLCSVTQTDASEDSNKRESARAEQLSAKEAANSVSPSARPTPPTKPKELDGYVGFANLPNQVYRKAVKKGFDFTLMVVGAYSSLIIVLQQLLYFLFCLPFLLLSSTFFHFLPLSSTFFHFLPLRATFPFCQEIAFLA